MHDRLPELLASRLRAPLPGPAAGRAAEDPGCQQGRGPENARPAAVLVLLYPHQNRWHLPLTLRPEDLADHGGQVSLPGGAVEAGETSREAALREFHEELGAAGHPVTVLGHLSAVYVRASNFQVTPWVAATDRRPPLAPNPKEVTELIEIPLDYLLDPANLATTQRPPTEGQLRSPCFRWQSHQIWGATCLILRELVAVLKDLRPGT